LLDTPPRNHLRLRSYVCIGLLPLTLSPLTCRQASADEGPSLMVVLVVDQMRRDYVDRFQDSWTGGLRRMLDTGAIYVNAEYPYLATVTCAGHATVGTGAYPSVHGIVLNAWWDRRLGQTAGCAVDPDTPLVGYGAPVEGGVSARRLEIPTFAEELRSQVEGARSVALSLKDRSALMLVGREADVVTWFDGRTGTWATSSAYAQQPLPFLADFIERHPVEQALSDVWTRRLDPSRYQGADDAAGEDPPRGWTPVFPHALDAGSHATDAAFFRRWEASPFSDAYLEQMAEAIVEALGLGRRTSPDFLAIGFSALDMVGHNFGPGSQEVQDVLAHLDVTLDRLFTFLDERVGADRYVVALTSDHGIPPIPEPQAARGLDAGRVAPGMLVSAVEQALEDVLGTGPHVARLTSSNLYFVPARADAILSDPRAVSAAKAALTAFDGVERVISPDELAAPGSDELRRAASLSYFPGRSGDLLVVLEPGWLYGDSRAPSPATNHGSASDDDRHVPVILMGAGVRAGRYHQPASPADIAPTLAALSGVTLAHAQGRVLGESLDTERPDR